MNRLLNALVARAGPLPPVQARNQIVSPPPSLPPQFRFGNVAPGPVQNPSQTGGAIQNPMSLTAPFAPSFTAPTYQAPGGTAPGILRPPPVAPNPVFEGGPARQAITAANPPPQTSVYGSPAAQAFLQSRAPTGVYQGGGTPAPALPVHPLVSSALIAALAGQGRKLNPSVGGGRLAV